jgi:hypothetical protein
MRNIWLVVLSYPKISERQLGIIIPSIALKKMTKYHNIDISIEILTM